MKLNFYLVLIIYQFIVGTSEIIKNVGDDLIFKNENQLIDHQENCYGWAKRGECIKNPNYMLKFCSKSCNQFKSVTLSSPIIDNQEINSLDFSVEIETSNDNDSNITESFVNNQEKLEESQKLEEYHNIYSDKLFKLIKVKEYKYPIPVEIKPSERNEEVPRSVYDIVEMDGNYNKFSLKLFRSNVVIVINVSCYNKKIEYVQKLLKELVTPENFLLGLVILLVPSDEFNETCPGDELAILNCLTKKLYFNINPIIPQELYNRVSNCNLNMCQNNNINFNDSTCDNSNIISIHDNNSSLFGGVYLLAKGEVNGAYTRALYKYLKFKTKTKKIKK